jgi:hypothetical protein
MKKILFSILIITSYIINSCCDCNTNPVNNPVAECSVRETTITEFNADLIKVDTILKPGPYYSVHSFLFPNNKYLTGTLVNDERFARTGEVLVATRTFSNASSYKLAILDNNPINSNMIGDILVDTVYAKDTTAELKFKGELTRLDSAFLSDDAELFCEYIKFNKNFITNSITNLSKFGKNVRNSRVPKIFTNSDLKILNANSENVTGQTGTPTPTNEDINGLLTIVNSENVVILVKPGEIFLYKTASGGLYVVLVTNISNGILQPNKGRVSIMFNRIN